MKLSELVEASLPLEDLIDKFIEEYSGLTGKKEWGDSLDNVCEEPGNCSMISNTLQGWLSKNGVKATTIVGSGMKNKKWNVNHEDGKAIDDHTCVLVGDKVVDLNARQFDPTLPFPRIITLAKFKSEWSSVD